MNSKRLMFLGSKKAGLIALERLIARLPSGSIQAIVCPDDRTDFRTEYGDFLSLSSSLNIPFYVVISVKETMEIIKRYKPQTVIVHGWYQIIPTAQFPETEFFGFHYSLLPHYRGSSPLVWQIINGEPKLGVSFFSLSEGMDEGPLIDQKYFELFDNEDISDALKKADGIVGEMIDDFSINWRLNKIKKYNQPDIEPTYCGLRVPGDARIDWTQDARKVLRLIKAQSHPYNGAFCFLADGKTVKIWRARLEARKFFGVAGAIVEVQSDAIVVACGSGALHVEFSDISVDDNAESSNFLRSIKTRLL